MVWKEYRVGGRRFSDYKDALDYAFDPERFDVPPKIEELGTYYKMRDALANLVAWAFVIVVFASVATMCRPPGME